MFTVASRFRRLKFVGSYLSTIEAVGTGSWLSVVQVLLDVSIALLVAIIEFHGGIHRGYRTISSEFFFVKRYTQGDLKKFLKNTLWIIIYPQNMDPTSYQLIFSITKIEVVTA